MMSWDTQGGGLGFLVERGVAIGKSVDGSNGVDMARLLGRTPKSISYDDSADDNTKHNTFGT